VQDIRLLVKGNIGNVFVGGTLQNTSNAVDAGQIMASGKIGSVHVVGDINGGAASYSGIDAGTGIGKVTVDGSVLGGTGFDSSAIIARYGNLGPVLIRGDARAGNGFYSAAIQCYIQTDRLPVTPFVLVKSFDVYESATVVEAGRFSHRVGKVQCPTNP